MKNSKIQLPTKPGFDLEAFKNGVPAFTKDNQLRIYRCELDPLLGNDDYSICCRDWINYDDWGRSNKSLENDLIAMLDLATIGKQVVDGAIEQFHQQKKDDEELLVKFACASLTGRLSSLNNQLMTSGAIAQLAFYDAESMLDELKKRRAGK